MTLTAGTRLGTYEILGPLGAGGMGEVYRAKDHRLGREVAIKVLPAEVASSPDRLARFEREARTVAGLNHPNIVVLHSVEDEDGVRFLTMELVEGQTLSDLVVPGGLPAPRILELAIPLTDALVAAHEKGVIHRDLKPGNLMVTREGRPKILDFGLAKATRSRAPADDQASTMTADVSISVPGQIMGTLSYMAPEQIRGETLDARTDLFALGVILYELAAGRRPFTGATSADVISSILRDTPQPLSRVRADLPSDLDRIVGRCLEKNPRGRFQTALDVLNELRLVRHRLVLGNRTAFPGPATEGIASIAVLPFVNRSQSVEDEYFSDGLADELLNVLSKIKGLRVSARASSFHFKGRSVPLADVGKALNVATIVDGSVRKVGDRVRISVELVKVTDGYQLWSATYDRTLDDIFAVQDDIAQSVVKELRAALMSEKVDSRAAEEARADVARASIGRGTAPEAHRLYLLARHLMVRSNREVVAKAIEYLKQALNLDPNFALAWAELSGAYAFEASRGWAPVTEGYERARGAAEQALSLEPNLAEGHHAMRRIRIFHDWDWRGAEESNVRALELAPANAELLNGAGVLARFRGDMNEALKFHRRALEQNPLSAGAYGLLGDTFEAMDRFAEAEDAYRKMLELAPQAPGVRAYLSLALLGQGRGEEAVAEVMAEQSEVSRLWALGIVHHVLGRELESNEALGALIEKHAETMACQIAEVQAARGELDAAFEWLERAYTQRDPGLAEAKTNPHLRPLHGDPRWGPFLRKMGLED